MNTSGSGSTLPQDISPGNAESKESSDLRFKSIFDHALESLVITNSEKEIILINPAAEKLFGYQAGEVTGKKIEVFIPDRFRNKHVHHRDAYSKNPLPRPMGSGTDVTARRKDGSEIPVEISLCQFEEHGEQYYLIFAADITRRKQAQDGLLRLNREIELRAEEKVRQTQELFYKTFHSSPVATYLTEVDSGCFINVNEAFEELFQLNREDIIGKSAVDLNIMDVVFRRELVRQTKAGHGKVKNLEIRIRKKNGDACDVLAFADTIGIGKPCLLGTLVDISENKKAEEAIRKSNELFSKLFKENPLGIVISNLTDGVITDCNEAFLQLTGYPANEVHGKTIHDLDLLDYFGEESELVDEVLSNGSVKDVETYIKSRDGLLRWVSVSMQSIRVDHKPCLLSVFLDLTVHREAEQKINSALQKEKELNDLKSSFVSLASHEFRTPLGGILSSATLLEKYTTTEQQESRNRHINRIKVSVKNLNNILDEFLSIGKIEDGKLVPKPEKFDLEEFTGKLCNEIKGISKPGQSIVYNHEGEKDILLDPVFVRHILTNLSSNAIKYSPENSSIYIRTKSENGKIILNVKDEGIGIPEEDQKRLFEKFFRASNVG
ncbi:MAG: PAS domain S-box protein, partial [Bacteroidetes bacterium]|nr:PAS domain S-box protein [Bacteroidota bacterium]